MLNNIVDNIEQCGQDNIVQSCVVEIFGWADYFVLKEMLPEIIVKLGENFKLGNIVIFEAYLTNKYCIKHQ